MIKGSKFFVFFAAFYLGSWISFCTADPTIHTALSSPKITAAETVLFTLTTEWPSSEGNYTFAVPNLSLKNLTITNQSQSQESFLQNNEPWNRKTFAYELTPQEAGEGLIHEFVLGYVNPAKPEPGEFQVGALTLQVTPSRNSQNISWQGFALAAGGGLGIAAVIFFFLRKKTKRILIHAPETTPQEAAVQKVRKAVQEIERFNPENLHRLNKEFREFLKEIYGVPVRLSESEAAEQLKGHSLSPEESKKMARVLERLAEAKYMGASIQDFDFQFLKREIQELAESKLVTGSIS